MQAAIVFQLTCTFFAEFETHYTTFQGLKQPLKLGTHRYILTSLCFQTGDDKAVCHAITIIVFMKTFKTYRKVGLGVCQNILTPKLAQS